MEQIQTYQKESNDHQEIEWVTKTEPPPSYRYINKNRQPDLSKYIKEIQKRGHFYKLTETPYGRKGGFIIKTIREELYIIYSYYGYDEYLRDLVKEYNDGTALARNIRHTLEAEYFKPNGEYYNQILEKYRDKLI